LYASSPDIGGLTMAAVVGGGGACFVGDQGFVGGAVDDPVHAVGRQAGQAARVDATVEELRVVLPAAPSRPVRRPTWGPWSISLDDFVTSRLLEVVVHCDDLAYSVGVSAPELPAQAIETVVDVLSRIAIRRHGATSVLRALSRAERAPVSISAL
jgi:hypothetical protein